MKQTASTTHRPGAVVLALTTTGRQRGRGQAPSRPRIASWSRDLVAALRGASDDDFDAADAANRASADVEAIASAARGLGEALDRRDVREQVLAVANAVRGRDLAISTGPWAAAPLDLDAPRSPIPPPSSADRRSGNAVFLPAGASGQGFTVSGGGGLDRQEIALASVPGRRANGTPAGSAGGGGAPGLVVQGPLIAATIANDLDVRRVAEQVIAIIEDEWAEAEDQGGTLPAGLVLR